MDDGTISILLQATGPTEETRLSEFECRVDSNRNSDYFSCKYQTYSHTHTCTHNVIIHITTITYNTFAFLDDGVISKIPAYTSDLCVHVCIQVVVLHCVCQLLQVTMRLT